MVLTLSRRRMRLLLTMFDGLNTNSLMDIPLSLFVDVDCEPKTLGRSSISCSPSDSFESFDCFIMAASSGILSQSILDCSWSYSQKEGYLQLLWHRLRQSPMLNLLQQVSNQKLQRMSEYRYCLFGLLYYQPDILQFLSRPQISTMKKQQERTSDKLQSVVNSILQKESQNISTDSTLDCSSSAQAQVYLGFTLTSYEALMTLAITQNEYFPAIDFFVESCRHFENGYEPEVNIIFTANESKVVNLQRKFKSIDININKSEPIDRIGTQNIKIGDYFSRTLFNNGKHAVLKTQYYSEHIQKLFAQGQFLFGCTTLPLKKIDKNTYIVSNTAVNDPVTDKSTNPPNFFPQFIPLVDRKCYFKINSTSESQEIAFPNLQLAHYLEIDEIDEVNANIRIDQTISIFLQATFKNEEALKEFLIKNYAKLQKVINFDIVKYKLKRVMDFSELPQFFLQLSNRIKYVDEYLNLVDQKGKYITTNHQSNFSQISSCVYGELKHKLEFGGDLLCLQPYWCPQLKEDFLEVFNRWEIEKHDRQPIFSPLFYILNDKIRREFIVGTETTSSLYEMVYPGITAIVDLFASKLTFKTAPMRGKPNILDDILMDYIKEIDAYNKNVPPSLILGNKYADSLKNFIAKFQGFRNASLKWVDVFNCLTIGLRRSSCSYGDVSCFVRQIEECRYPALDCVGCSKFFYYNYTNILSPYKRVPIQIIHLVEKMSDYQTQILEAICVMLNNHGGVILFNCVREYKQILPRGALLNEKDKEAIENKLNHMLSYIYPRPEIGTNVTVSFVPLATHPLNKDLPKLMQRYVGEEDLKPNQIHCKLMYMEGVFVTRIKVCPTDRSKVYLHSIGNDYYYLYGISKIQKTFAIKKLYKAIKIKFNNSCKSKLLQYRQKTFESPLNHKCHLPDSGVIMDSKSINTPQSEYCDFSGLEDEFSHISMLSCNSKYLPQVKDRLQAKGVRCELEIRFSNRPLKSAVNTAVLYHDCKFEEILRLCRLKEFEFEGRHVVAIYVSKFVKIEETNSPNLEDNVAAGAMWLRKDFPKERLRLFEMKVGRKREFFLQTDSKLSTLFMYHVFQSFNIKVSLKNPMNFSKSDESIYKDLKEINYCRNNQSLEEVITIPEPSSTARSGRQTLISLEESEES